MSASACDSYVLRHGVRGCHDDLVAPTIRYRGRFSEGVRQGLGELEWLTADGVRLGEFHRSRPLGAGGFAFARGVRCVGSAPAGELQGGQLPLRRRGLASERLSRACHAVWCWQALRCLRVAPRGAVSRCCPVWVSDRPGRGIVVTLGGRRGLASRRPSRACHAGWPGMPLRGLRRAQREAGTRLHGLRP